jgi:hypothetical protein
MRRGLRVSGHARFSANDEEGVMRFLLAALAASLLAGIVPLVSLAALVTPEGAPSEPILTSGPPDTCPWGYTWKDSDHNPGEITYDWKEVSGIGTEITALGDETGFGPFPIGFDFAYYWYTSSVFYFGANGYISLTDGVVQLATFPNIPSRNRPNGTIAAMMSDLLFPGDSAQAFYWTNATNDTCIIEYKNVPFWDRDVGWDGLNTFEIILSKPDSSITYQYALHDKGTYDYRAECMTVGIEDRTGDWGLSWMYAETSTTDSIHAGLAIKFKDWSVEPDPPVYDLASVEVQQPGTKGFFVAQPESIIVWGKIGNVGTQAIDAYRVFGKVEKNRGLLGWQTIWQDTLDILTPIGVGEVDSVAFADRPFYCNLVAEYRIMVSCTTALDTRPADNGTSDADKAECHGVTLLDTLKAVLTYDNTGTSASSSIFLGSQTGLCNRYTPPRYPAYLAGFGANLTGNMQPVALTLWDDDGPGGSPGTVVFQDTISPHAGYNEIELDPTCHRVESGSVYAGIWVVSETGPEIVLDADNPYSRQGWELVEGRASCFRQGVTTDLATHLTIQMVPGGPDVEVHLNCLTPVIMAGDTLRYEAAFTNGTSQVQVVKYWAKEKDPQGGWRQAIPPTEYTLNPQETLTETLEQAVDPEALLGQWEYHGYLGPDTSTVWSDDVFSYMVISPVTLTLNCLTPVVRRGETLSYQYTFTNNSARSEAFQYWTKVKMPNGGWRNALPPTGFALAPFDTATYTMNHPVPTRAPFGLYEYWGYVGRDTSQVWDVDMFMFRVRRTAGD